MAATVRAKRTRARAPRKGWRLRDVAVATGAVALVVVAGVAIYVRERRLQDQRQQEHIRALREIDAMSTRSMTPTERDAHRRRVAELEREAEARANR